jgi:hypothetical protein
MDDLLPTLRAMVDHHIQGTRYHTKCGAKPCARGKCMHMQFGDHDGVGLFAPSAGDLGKRPVEPTLVAHARGARMSRIT